MTLWRIRLISRAGGVLSEGVEEDGGVKLRSRLVPRPSRSTGGGGKAVRAESDGVGRLGVGSDMAE